MPFSLAGKRGLVVGIANHESIAAGCARAFVNAGATLAATYLNAKAEPFVRVVTDSLACDLVLPCDVRVPGQLEAVFETIRTGWGRLDFLLHAVAFAPREDLHGRVVDSSAEGFGIAMDISCHSFLRMARLAEPLMTGGGCLLTVTFYGSERVVEHYNLMGPVKAALESAVRYTAAELGPKGIRAHAISPGPIRTRAASGIEQFDELMVRAAAQAPERHLVDVDDVGALAAFLVGDGAKHITGTVIPVDGGQHLMA
ncbi:MAG TPA: enoyl-ACP reductase FabI [Rhodopila sp.]|uniref:enoyl-ACP reductase FabI n=1 Tax=Rhodopila sp. TaxID=2480087 RepID=UPI002C28B57A|nr:enoyl-ACP reductase FabI [Rhodopila sp.]HVY17272.1 enoyl-ACP reductase FabI [Rhodopila sp.]